MKTYLRLKDRADDCDVTAPGSELVDVIALALFTFEATVKIAAEGERP